MMRQLTWNIVMLLVVAFVSVAGFYATGAGGFAITGAMATMAIILLLWVWAIQSLTVRGYQRLVAGYIVVLLGASLVSIAGFYVTGIGDFAVTGAIAIALLLLAAGIWVTRLRRARCGNVTCEVTK